MAGKNQSMRSNDTAYASGKLKMSQSVLAQASEPRGLPLEWLPGRPRSFEVRTPTGWISMPPMKSTQTACFGEACTVAIAAQSQARAEASIPDAPLQYANRMSAWALERS